MNMGKILIDYVETDLTVLFDVNANPNLNQLGYIDGNGLIHI